MKKEQQDQLKWKRFIRCGTEVSAMMMQMAVMRLVRRSARLYFQMGIIIVCLLANKTSR